MARKVAAAPKTIRRGLSTWDRLPPPRYVPWECRCCHRTSGAFYTDGGGTRVLCPGCILDTANAYDDCKHGARS